MISNNGYTHRYRERSVHFLNNTNNPCFFHGLRILFIITLIIIFTDLIQVVVNASSAAGQDTLIGITGKDFIMIGADQSLSSSITLTSTAYDKIRVLVDPFPVGDVGHSIHHDDVMSCHQHQQQAIVLACAGERADIDRLFNVLRHHVCTMEYEASIGCDVKCIFHGRYSTDDTENEVQQSASSSCTPTFLDWNKHISFQPTVVVEAGLDAENVAYLARREISTSLRSRGRLSTCLLIAGMVPCLGYPSSTSSTSSSTISDELRTNDDESPSSLFAHRIQKQVQLASNHYQIMDKTISQQVKIQTIDPMIQNQDINHHTFLTHQTYHGSTTNISLQPRLYWLDEYGSLKKVEYGAHGLGSNFILSILDRGYHNNLTRQEAATLIRSCFQQLQSRYIINCPTPPCIKCVDATGCHLFQD